jgi:integrase/recombinase XerD
MSKPGSRVCRVVVTGPLAPFADAYRAELRARGYTALTTVNELRQMARLSRWLEAGGLTAGDLSSERVEKFLAVQRAAGRRGSCSWLALTCLLDVLGGLGVLTARDLVPVGSADDGLLAAFERYLVGERGLGAATAVHYVIEARRFLGALAGSDRLAGLIAGDVTVIVVRETAAMSVAVARNFVSGLRAFLQFCLLEGIVKTDLSAAALFVAGRRSSPLPRGISRAQAAALLASCDRRTGLGRRDYALLIVLLRLGLRRGEVAALTLDDIDWRHGEVVVHGKGGREDRLPLPVDVGEAIAGYLRHGRPATDRREVFLRARAPIWPIAAGTVASTVRRACRRAGVPEIGSHRLRHTVACEMVAAQVPLPQIGQVLRHRSLQSTAIYARADVDQLRALAQPWPGAPQ